MLQTSTHPQEIMSPLPHKRKHICWGRLCMKTLIAIHFTNWRSCRSGRNSFFEASPEENLGYRSLLPHAHGCLGGKGAAYDRRPVKIKDSLCTELYVFRVVCPEGRNSAFWGKHPCIHMVLRKAPSNHIFYFVIDFDRLLAGCTLHLSKKTRF